MAIQNFTLPKPRNDDDWELWCKRIFADIYGLPDFQRFETRGKNQKGIDLIAKLDDASVVVIQCKRRSTEKQLTEDEANADYAASKKIAPKPSHFIIATTHDKKGLQEWALAKTNPTAQVYAWGDIENLLAERPQLRKALYGSEDYEEIARRIEQPLADIKRSTRAIRNDARAIRQAVVDKPNDESLAFYDAYTQHVNDELDELELFGVEIPNDIRRYKLSVAYISLNLESNDGKHESAARSAESIFAECASNRLLIRGDAGSGKSTLLKWAAIRCRGQAWDFGEGRCVASVGGLFATELPGTTDNPFMWHAPLPKPHALSLSHGGRLKGLQVSFQFGEGVKQLPWWLRVPFLIRLRDCKGGKLPSLAEYAKRTANLNCAVPKDWEESVLKAGQALVLLDGIDEVPPNRRDPLHKQIRKLIKDYPENMFILTTRPLSEGEPDWLNELQFQQARVAPMSRTDREACIDNWHRAVSEKLTRTRNEDSRLQSLPGKLKNALNDAPEIARLATNPLLCAMICALHRSKNHLPENLNELLDSLTRILLYDREKQTPEFDLKEFDPRYADLSCEDRIAIVSHLAEHMILEGESSLSKGVVKTKIGEVLQHLKDRSPSDADIVLKGLLERSGMLREKTASTIDFIHNTFKEYLAALRFLDSGKANLLARNAHEAGWDNVAVFAGAAAVRNPEFSDKLVAAILPNSVGRMGGPNQRRAVFRKAADVSEEAAKQYKRAVTAIRVVSAIRTKLNPETAKRLAAIQKSLFPLRSLSDAAGLATAGNTVLKFVKFTPKLSPPQRMRCVRALRLIGTPEANECLQAYMNDQDIDVIAELAYAVNPLSIPAVFSAFAYSNKDDGEASRNWHWHRVVVGAIPQLRSPQFYFAPMFKGRGDLTSLDCRYSGFSDADLGQVCSGEWGLRALTTLNLGRTQVTDAGLKKLARADIGLKALTTLDLGYTQVTDAGLKELARADSGLKALTTLNLSSTQVTDAGLKELARADSGLKALTTLDLDYTQVTDAGLKELARADSGLKALTTLNLFTTKVTDAGLKELRQARPDLKIER